MNSNGRRSTTDVVFVYIILIMPLSFFICPLCLSSNRKWFRKPLFVGASPADPRGSHQPSACSYGRQAKFKLNGDSLVSVQSQPSTPRVEKAFEVLYRFFFAIRGHPNLSWGFGPVWASRSSQFRPGWFWAFGWSKFAVGHPASHIIFGS